MEQEQRWIMERLDTLSVKEQSTVRGDPADREAGGAGGKTGWELETAYYTWTRKWLWTRSTACFRWRITRSASPRELCAAGSFYLRHESHLPERAMYYADLEALGRRYEDRHPGLFVGNCYVEYPNTPPHSLHRPGLIPEDDVGV
ncbi:hypothetical protein LAWASA_4465 [Lawsonibacter asaccharolyticus]|nr:hypothetical protein LAWASA_4465 [Lawsonibacter asaccharolyticus]